MIIRKAKVKDKDQLTSLFKEFYVDFNRKQLFSDQVMMIQDEKNIDKSIKQTINDYLSKHKFIFLIAERKSKIIGYICGQIKQRKNKLMNKEGYIEEWFVNEYHRNSEIGKALYNKLIDQFKKKNCTHLGVCAYSDNKKAIDIYRKLGFFDFSLEMKKIL